VFSVIGLDGGIHQWASSPDEPGAHVDEVVDHFLRRSTVGQILYASSLPVTAFCQE